MAMSKQDKNTAVLKALGHPIRRKILEQLEGNHNGGLSPSMLSEELGEPLGNVSYHIRVLAETTAVKLMKTRPRRGAVEHFYKRPGNAVDKQIAKVLDLINK